MGPMLRSAIQRAPVALAFALLLALSLPGIRVRAADEGIAPKASELLRLNAPTPAAEAPPPGDACAPADPAAQARQIEAQREAMRKMAEVAAANGDGDVKVLDGRGVGYHVEPDRALELMRIQIEAQRQLEALHPPQAPAQP